jgi:UDP-N-acetyl-D-mannosaminuronic acid dehydrogenase
VDLLAPILESSGLRAGKDFYLAYTPERVLPGQILQELIENARVIGGVDRASAEAGRDLYQVFVRGEIHLTDSTTAEMVKLMENTYRDVNIALANEYARLADSLGVDAWHAIQLANLHPRVNILRPGPGVGGHCISVDPWFLVQAAPDRTDLIQVARRVNDLQPEFVRNLIDGWLGGLQGRKLAALGLAYKADVDDLRESPAIDLVGRLVEAGAEITTFEPNILAARVEGASNAVTLEGVLQDAEALLLLVDHEPFRNLDPGLAAKHMPGRLAVDLRGVWKEAGWKEAGFKLRVLGVGEEHG